MRNLRISCLFQQGVSSMSVHTRNSFPFQNNWRLRPLVIALSLAFFSSALAEEVEFNLDNMDISDRENIDMSQFSRAGYMMPGQYDMAIKINDNESPTEEVTFLPSEHDENETVACLTPKMMAGFGLKKSWLDKVTYWNNEKCARLDIMPGIILRPDLASSTLYMSVPQAYIEYQTANWDPPSRWDEGIAGFIADYNTNFNYSSPAQGSESRELSGNGVVGVNAGPWRMRAFWNGTHYTANNTKTSTFNWNQYQAFRAIKPWGAKLIIGQNDLASDVFENARYVGASLISDDGQLPPNLRGYAPEVRGVAKTNAKVTISHAGRVLYESQVAPGPFIIQDLSDSITGTLDVKVEEQDGSIQTFQVETASVPYLSRPGQVRFKAAVGQTTDDRFHLQNERLMAGEFSWGISNGWSLLGGGLSSGKYHAASLGAGRDLLSFGALALTATQSYAKLPNNQTRSGGSYSLSYSKRFENYDTQVTFAGYRFTEKSYLSLNQYLEASRKHLVIRNNAANKQTYTVSLNKQFRTLGVSAFLNYNYQTYWNRQATSRWNMSFARYFDVGNFKNVSFNLSAYRAQNSGIQDDGVFLSLNVPFGTSSGLNINPQNSDAGQINSLSWYNRMDERNSYRLGANVERQQRSAYSGYYTHTGDNTLTNYSASYKPGQYRSAALSMQGGLTATAHGAALHRTIIPGGTRLMLDTEGISDVPIKSSGAATHSNKFGKAVLADVSSYIRNQAHLDINQLNDDIEAESPVLQLTLTEGAIGYRRFRLIKGQKLMAVIRLSDGSYPPFGASVLSKGRETGIVDEMGSVWLSGVNPEMLMDVRWNGNIQCQITFPKVLPIDESGETNLLLPCTEKE